MTTHNERIRSIHTPPRLSSITPSKRPPREDDGPTPFQLMRKAEAIGQGVACDVTSRKVEITGGKINQAKAEFATSSALARLYHEDRIVHPQYRAGCEYGRLRRLLFGSSVPRESGLTKVLASSIEDRIHVANQAAREQRDDAEHADWLAEQRTLFERGEYSLSRLMRAMPQRAKHVHAKISTFRLNVRQLLRCVCVDDQMPKATQVQPLRIGLQALADTWEIE
jgi:hypothetical protein